MQQNAEGSKSTEQGRGVFERAEAAAVILFKTDTKSVILVKRFRTPILGNALTGVGIPEAIIGAVKRNETAEEAAARITRQMTGYKITQPTQIAKFFSSPGESPECIHLYYAAVRSEDSKRRSGINKTDGERIQIIALAFDELLRLTRSNRIEIRSF